MQRPGSVVVVRVATGSRAADAIGPIETLPTQARAAGRSSSSRSRRRSRARSAHRGPRRPASGSHCGPSVRRWCGPISTAGGRQPTTPGRSSCGQRADQGRPTPRWSRDRRRADAERDQERPNRSKRARDPARPRVAPPVASGTSRDGRDVLGAQQVDRRWGAARRHPRGDAAVLAGADRPPLRCGRRPRGSSGAQARAARGRGGSGRSAHAPTLLHRPSAPPLKRSSSGTSRTTRAGTPMTTARAGDVAR